MARKPSDSPRAQDAQKLSRQFDAVKARIDDINAKGSRATKADFAALGKLMKDQARLNRDMQNPSFKKLFNAAGDGQLARVRKYIEQDGFDVDTRNYGGYTPLAYAVSDGSVVVSTYLIEKGADVNARTNEGLTPLSIAAAKNNAKLFVLLLENGASPRTRTRDGLSVRKLAEFNGSHAVLALLDDREYMAQFNKPQAKANKPKR